MALDATVHEAASDLRALEGQRLDELLRHWWPQALRSNPALRREAWSGSIDTFSRLGLK